MNYDVFIELKNVCVKNWMGITYQHNFEVHDEFTSIFSGCFNG